MKLKMQRFQNWKKSYNFRESSPSSKRHPIFGEKFGASQSPKHSSSSKENALKIFGHSPPPYTSSPRFLLSLNLVWRKNFPALFLWPKLAKSFSSNRGAKKGQSVSESITNTQTHDIVDHVVYHCTTLSLKDPLAHPHMLPPNTFSLLDRLWAMARNMFHRRKRERERERERQVSLWASSETAWWQLCETDSMNFSWELSGMSFQCPC